MNNTQVVILAGGLGTRISEETNTKPKPMVSIGGKPILWHIMKVYSHHGFNDFIICAGYMGNIIKEYFANYFLNMSDITFDMINNEMIVHQKKAEPWKVTIVDTGLESMTGERLRRIRPYIKNDYFCATYGDVIGNINIPQLVESHLSDKSHITLTGVQPPGRYGALRLNEKKVVAFKEKLKGDGSWVNGGFFVINSDILNTIPDTNVPWEEDPLESHAQNNLLGCYKHHGFWHPMDTLRDKKYLESLWVSGNAPWQIWK